MTSGDEELMTLASGDEDEELMARCKSQSQSQSLLLLFLPGYRQTGSSCPGKQTAQSSKLSRPA